MVKHGGRCASFVGCIGFLFVYTRALYLDKFTVERIGEPGMKPHNVRWNVESPWIDVSKWLGELACGHWVAAIILIKVVMC